MTFTPYILLACFLAGNAACAQTPGRTAQAMQRAAFVDVRSMDSFTGRVLYTDLHEAYLHPKAARALAKAQKILKTSHPELSLKVYDAARPMHIQQKMWNVVAGTPKNIYVSNPKNGGGLHNYGMAVDLTLCDAKGDTLSMDTKIDYLGKLAHIDNEAEMVKQGKLTPEARSTEWWHFNFITRAEAKAHYKPIP